MEISIWREIQATFLVWWRPLLVYTSGWKCDNKVDLVKSNTLYGKLSKYISKQDSSPNQPSYRIFSGQCMQARDSSPYKQGSVPFSWNCYCPEEGALKLAFIKNIVNTLAGAWVTHLHVRACATNGREVTGHASWKRILDMQEVQVKALLPPKTPNDDTEDLHVLLWLNRLCITLLHVLR